MFSHSNIFFFPKNYTSLSVAPVRPQNQWWLIKIAHKDHGRKKLMNWTEERGDHNKEKFYILMAHLSAACENRKILPLQHTVSGRLAASQYK